MVCDCMVIEFHTGVSERSVLGNSAFDAHAPPFKRARCERNTHRLYDLSLIDSQALLNGFKGRSVFPSHLNESRHLALGQGFAFFGFHKSNIAKDHRYAAKSAGIDQRGKWARKRV